VLSIRFSNRFKLSEHVPELRTRSEPNCCHVDDINIPCQVVKTERDAVEITAHR